MSTAFFRLSLSLVVLGVSGYAFVAVTGLTLGEIEARDAVTFYLMANIVGPGLFYALEQVANRETSRASTDPVSRNPRVQRDGLVLVVAATVTTAALGPLLVPAVLHDNWAVYLCVVIVPPVTGLLHLARGELAGGKRHGTYAATILAEGMVRILICALLASLGAGSAWVFCLGYVAATASSAGFARWSVACTASPGPRPRPTLLPPTGLTLVACSGVLAQAVPSVVPLVVTARLDDGDDQALTFACAAVLARVPLLVLSPLQALLIPRMVLHVGTGQHRLVRRDGVAILALCAGLAGAGALSYVALGGRLLDRLFDSAAPNAFVLSALAISTAALVAAHLLQAAAIAMGKDRQVAVGWGLAVACACGLAFLPGRVTLGEAAVAHLSGAVAALLFMLFAVSRARFGDNTKAPTRPTGR